MSNVFAPNGFTPVRRIDGAAWDDQITKRLIASANTNKFYKGDPVSVLSTGYIDVVAPGSLPTQGVLGIFMGCQYLSTASGSPKWSPQFPGGDAAADVTAYICMDPNVVFRAQVGNAGATGGPAVLGDLNKNFNFAFGSGNTLSGISGAYLDYSTKATTDTLPFTLIGLVQDPPGVNGTDTGSAGNIVEVVFNQSAFKVGTTGV